MRNQVQELLRGYGQNVTLRSAAGEQAARVFLQPVTERGEQEVAQMTALGVVDGRLWLYLGMAEVKADDRILWNGVEFRVRSSRPYYIGETLLYWWAALERAKEAVT